MKKTHSTPVAIVLFAIFFVLTSTLWWPTVASAYTHWGYVAARGRVLDDDGNPIWAEFAEDGSVVRDIDDANADILKNASVMSGADYRAYAQAYRDIDDQYGDQSDVLTREEFESRTFKRADNTVIDPGTLQLKASTRSVVVRHEALILDDSVSLILHESPLDLRPLVDIADTVQSVLLTQKGEVINASENNIGYRVAYYTLKGSTEHYDGISRVVGSFGIQRSEAGYQWGMYNMEGFDRYEDQLRGPLAGVEVEGWNNDSGYTDDTGYFEVQGPPAIIRGGSLSGPSHALFAKLRFTAWDPQDEYRGIYIIPRYAAIPPRRHAKDVVKIQVDAAVVTGQAKLYNPSGGYVPQAEATTYHYAAPSFVPYGTSPTRVPDTAPDFSDQGLLATISESDMANTDIYIFRASNGMLITSRQGLTDHEFKHDYDTGLYNEAICYHMMIRGAQHWYSDLSPLAYDDYKKVTNVHEKLRPSAADHLRSGEQVKVVIVNRATGYIGTGTGTVGQSVYTNEQGAEVRTDSVDVSIGPIYLAPPNLKLKAERVFDVQHGLTKGETYENIIGFEGSGLTSDRIIAVTSEWYDWDGSPLPEDLPGYTGRLAKVVGPNQLKAAGGRIDNFEIKPGKHLQLVKLPQGELDNVHYYLHVSGERPEGNPNFSDTGAAAEGPLLYRPKNYVPVKVPVFDEAATNARKAAYQAALEGGATNLTPPEPAYHWFYRPEMQFSVFDLDQQNMQINVTDNDGQVHNLLLDELPTLSSAADQVQFIYSLIEDDLPVLQPLGPGRTMIFAIGDHELEATLGPDKELIFENLEDVNLLDTEDYLAIRLYQNGDDANVLWEWAFDKVVLAPPGIGDEITVSADDTQIVLDATILGYNSRDAEDQYEHKTIWSVEGAGSLEKTHEPVSKKSSHQNTLTLSTVADSSAVVSFSMDGNSNGVIYSKPFRVVPGAPASIEIEAQNGNAAIEKIGQISGALVIRDQYLNEVTEGTPVVFYSDDDIAIEHDPTTDAEGKVHFTIRGGAEAGQKTINVISGGVEISFTVDIEDVTISIEAPEVIDVDQTDLVIIRAECPVEGVQIPIEVGATRGQLSSNEVSVLTGGTSMLSFYAGDSKGYGEFVAIFGEKFVTKAFEVKYPDHILNVSNNIIIGDETVAGVETVEHIDDEGNTETLDVPYEVQSEVTLFGEPGEQRIATIGTWASPNVETILEYPLTNLVSPENEVQPRFGDAIGQGHNVSLVKDSPVGFENSYAFDGNAAVTIPDTAAIQLTNDTGISIALKAGSYGGTIVDFPASGQSVMLLADGRIRFQVTTTDGQFEVISDPISLSQWVTVSAHYKDSEIVLDINGDTATSPATGTLVPSTSTYAGAEYGMAIGVGLQGRAKAFKLFDWNGAQLLGFEDGSTTNTVTIPASGTITLQVYSLGNFGSANYAFNQIHPNELNIVGTAYAGILDDIKDKLYQKVDVVIEKTLAGIGKEKLIDFGLKILKKIKYYQQFQQDLLWGFLTGQQTQTAGGTIGDILAGVLMYGDFRDYVIHMYWLFRGNAEKYDRVIHLLACIGILTNALEIAGGAGAVATSWTGVGLVAGGAFTTFMAWADSVIAVAKVAFKLVKNNYPVFHKAVSKILTAAMKAIKNREIVLATKILNFIQFYIVIKELPPEVFQFFASAVKDPKKIWAWVDFIYLYLKVCDDEEKLQAFNTNSPNFQNAYAVSPKVSERIARIANRLVQASKDIGIEPHHVDDAIQVFTDRLSTGMSNYWGASSELLELAITAMAAMSKIGGPGLAQKVFAPSVYNWTSYANKTKFLQNIVSIDWRLVSQNPDVLKGIKEVLGKIGTDQANLVNHAKHGHMLIDAISQFMSNNRVIKAVEEKGLSVYGMVQGRRVKIGTINPDIRYTDDLGEFINEIKSWASHYKGDLSIDDLTAQVNKDFSPYFKEGSQLFLHIVLNKLPGQNAHLKVKYTLPKVCQNYRHVDISGTVRTGKAAIIEKLLDGIKKHKDWFSDKLGIIFETDEQFIAFINQTRQELNTFVEFLD